MNYPQIYERMGAEDRTMFYLIDAARHHDPLEVAEDVHRIATCINSLGLTDDGPSDFLTAAVEGFLAVIEDLLGKENCMEACLSFHSAAEADAREAAERIENSLLAVTLIGSPLLSVGIWTGNDAVRSLRNELATLSVDAGFELHGSNLKRMVIQLDEALKRSLPSGQCAVAGILRA